MSPFNRALADTQAYYTGNHNSAKSDVQRLHDAVHARLIIQTEVSTTFMRWSMLTSGACWAWQRYASTLATVHGYLQAAQATLTGAQTAHCLQETHRTSHHHHHRRRIGQNALLKISWQNSMQQKPSSTSSSAMAERPRELDQRFQVGGQFEAIIDGRVTFRAIATWRNLRLRIIW